MKALVVRLDGIGGVLLAGPAVRAVATGSTHVTLLCGPRGAPAARMLPHVDDVVVWRAPWEGPGAPAVHEADLDGLVDRLRQAAYDVALVLTAAHSSPLPAALVLRMAHVPRIGGDSHAPAGSLLDVRHRRQPGRHEARAGLDTAGAMGFLPGPGDTGLLRVLPAPDTATLTGNGPYIAVHPGAGAPSRTWDPDRFAETVSVLADAGHRVVVTGGPDERALTRHVSGDTGVDLGGRTDLRMLAGVLRGADVLVAGNTGPAQLAAATGTPVVSLFSPVVPADHWNPYGVPGVILGDQHSACAESRAHHCPVREHPCLNEVTAQDAASAVHKLLKAGT
ncbi:glycosyltransferase family 9 protein [Streptomyces sp. NPDC008313]|uniref:glycosyltransferase family 9 protein n=1 Tax=Streptomyces sp. NPDC008313 TaxID=3364826 RepID=UPI0036EA8D4B